MQWWFDLPWSSDFVRPERPIDMIRSHFTGWSDVADRVLATLTDDDLAHSPYPHFRHPIPRVQRQGALTLLGDAAHTMPPTLAQGTNQALLDTMVLCKALSGRRKTNNGTGDLSSALRWYEKTRRRKVIAVSRVASLQVSHGESVLKPAAMIPDRFMTWALTKFLASVSHRRISAEIDRRPRGRDDVELTVNESRSVEVEPVTDPDVPYGYAALSRRPNAPCGSSSGACSPSRTTPY